MALNSLGTDSNKQSNSSSNLNNNNINNKQSASSSEIKETFELDDNEWDVGGMFSKSFSISQFFFFFPKNLIKEIL